MVCLDIFIEVSQLSQYQALPRQGHLEAAHHIFAYLKKHTNGARVVFDPKTPEADERVFNVSADWTDFYGDVHEELPPKMPEPRGNPVSISCFVDANHAGNVMTHRSHSGILIYVQNAPIIWFQRGKTRLNPQVLGVSSSHYALLRILWWHYGISFECLEFPLTAQQMCSVIIMVL